MERLSNIKKTSAKKVSMDVFNAIHESLQEYVKNGDLGKLELVAGAIERMGGSGNPEDIQEVRLMDRNGWSRKEAIRQISGNEEIIERVEEEVKEGLRSLTLQASFRELFENIPELQVRKFFW